MKLNKKVLASSMAAAVALIGTVAPVTGVFAATSTITPGKSVDLNSVDHLGGTSGDALMGAMAQSGTTSGTAVANSSAQVGVISDVLTLDAVPDFNFGNAIPGKKVNLHNNVATSEDGNQYGLLQISDSRSTTTTTPGTDGGADVNTTTYGGGYTLQLAVSPFTPAESNNAAASKDSAAISPETLGAFALVFNKDNLNSNTGAWAQGADAASAAFANNTFTANDTPTDFVTSSAKDGASYGRVKAYLNNNHGSDIQLDVPAAADGGYTTNLTWTLTPTVKADV